MMLQNKSELENTRNLLAELEEHICQARQRPQTPENAESLAALVRTSNQLREEIVRCQSALRRAS